MPKILFLFFFFLLSHILYSQCPVGDVYLNSQSDVENFISSYGTCEVINGTIYIGDATDISGITSIKRIEGSLLITYSEIISVSNFGNLEFIGGDFKIDQSHFIETIEGINKLSTINGDFLITQNHSTLKHIKGFSALERMAGNFQVSENESLETISPFDNLLNVEGWFLIRRCNAMEKLIGFNKLIKIGTIFNVSSFKGNLSIENNDVLTEINGFNSLIEVVRNIDIGGNASLINVVGFSSLEKVINISFGGQLLVEIPIFDKLHTLGGLEVWSTGLTDVKGFNNVQVIGDSTNYSGNLYIKDNDSLLEITGFAKLIKIVAGLDIGQNNKLNSLAGFKNLVEVSHLGVGGNPSLVSLNGLENIFKVELEGGTAINVSGNNSLVDCSALCNLLSKGSVVGEVFILDNPSKCSSETEVREECIPDFDNDGILEICINSSSVDLFDSLTGTPDTGGVWTPSLTSGTGIFNPSIDTAGVYTYTVANGVCGSDTSEVIVTIDVLPNAGEDGNLEICINSSSVDLFDSLTGTPDTGGVWTPSLTSGTGIFNPSIDSAGIYTFTVTKGVCGSDTSEVIVTIDVLPNAGEDGNLEICINSSSVNLFDSLTGTPDTGGVWTPSLTSGTGMFNPSIDTAGVYTYTVANGVCGSDTSEVIVTIDVLPNAGEDGNLEICINSSSVNLFDSLTGTPDTGGVWTPSLTSGTGIFNPSIDTAGVYTYTVANGVCGSDTSEVIVTIDVLPNAGEDGNLEICINSSSVNLFDSLTGTPDTGGVWTPSLTSGTGIFNPSIDSAGIYTFTVTKGVCGSDISEVSVTITNVTPISDYKIKIKEFSSNNSIEVIIDSNLEYEFSLDGINYQSSNVFNNLTGGDYTIYVQEFNGCGILETMASILDYPKFFTPNNDGFNDTWNLLGINNQNYVIHIFDRFGKLLKQLNSFDFGWDGIYNGNELPSADYWFKITFKDGTVKNGHFSLKR
jgi:gliding motility-associated-like protein